MHVHHRHVIEGTHRCPSSPSCGFIVAWVDRFRGRTLDRAWEYVQTRLDVQLLVDDGVINLPMSGVADRGVGPGECAWPRMPESTSRTSILAGESQGQVSATSKPLMPPPNSPPSRSCVRWPPRVKPDPRRYEAPGRGRTTERQLRTFDDDATRGGRDQRAMTPVASSVHAFGGARVRTDRCGSRPGRRSTP